MSRPLRIGSLCSGSGGLDLSVEAVLDAELAWYAQYEPPDKNGKPDRHQYAAQIMAHHWPDIPNHGDITTIDYGQVEPVDILLAGWPCQDMSLAGLRRGLMPGTRSGLWTHVARAVRELRPSLVFLENVRSLTSAKAHSDLEHCPWCMGEAGEGGGSALPPLRALGAVLGDLADLGFDAEWIVLPAAAVGAPHRRERCFILAWPADAAGEGRRGGRLPPSAPGRDGQSGDAARQDAADDACPGLEARREGWPGGGDPSVARGVGSNAPGDGRNEGRPEPARQQRRSDAALGGGSTPADADGERLPGRPEQDREPHEPGLGAPRRDDALRRDQAAAFDWSGTPYAGAVARWERALDRPAPAPVNESGRLAPVFVEWLMGLPAGHVTDFPGLPRAAQLKALGNGVVPQQGAAALRMLLESAS